MLMNQVRSRQSRDAFTLIELTITIAIIAVVAGLILAAVFGVFGTSKQAATKAEMSAMETGFASLQQVMNNCTYYPSTLVLDEGSNYNPANAQDVATMAALQRAFGRNINLKPLAGGQFMDWNGNGTNDGRITLHGQHCLVFWLGGIPKWSGGQIVGMQGFSSDYVNPTLAPTAKEIRRGPYMNFQQSRLKSDSNFVIYLDPFSPGKPAASQQPYAYFSSGSSTNSYATTDCSSLDAPNYPQPYFTALVNATPQYANPSSFQIISAGEDGVWTVGGNFQLPLSDSPGGSDNLANFQNGRLSRSN